MHALLSIPALTAEDVASANELVGRSRSFAFSMGEETWTCRIVPPSTAVPRLVASLCIGSTVAWVGLYDADGIEAARTLLGDVPLSRLPRDLLPAVLSHLFEKPLDSLQASLGMPCQIDRVLGGDELDWPGQRVGILVETGSGRLTGIVALTPSTFGVVRQALAAASPAQSIDLAQLPLEAAVEIGMTQLPLDELRRLSVGDVVLIETTALKDADPRDGATGPAGVGMSQESRALVRFPPHLGWKVRTEGDSVVVVEPFAPAVTPPDALGELVANIIFARGRARATPAQLATLAPGARLDCRDAEMVQLLCQGRPWARGELVRIEQQYGVWLTAVNHAKNS